MKDGNKASNPSSPELADDLKKVGDILSGGVVVSSSEDIDPHRPFRSKLTDMASEIRGKQAEIDEANEGPERDRLEVELQDLKQAYYETFRAPYKPPEEQPEE